jgi:glycosyltransferase involved in cell wall biosynthesis
VISIGIPAFNGGDKLRLALASVIANDNMIERIIIVDDGNNREVLSGFNDSRIVYHQNPSRLGMWRNFIKALSLADTQYFSWLAEDDFISPSLGRAISLEIRHNAEAVAYMGIPTTHASNRGSKPPRCLILPSKESSAYNRVCDVFGSNSYGALFYSVFDRNKITKMPLEILCDYPSVQYSYDYVWMMHIAIQGGIGCIPEQLYFYDQSNWDASTSNQAPLGTAEVLLDKGMVYLLGVLISFFSFNCVNRSVSESYSVKQHRNSAWKRILEMIVSKYIIRAARSQLPRRHQRSHTLAQFIHSLAYVIDSRRALGDAAVLNFAQMIILKLSSDIELSALLDLPIRILIDPVWLSSPDFKLYKRKAGLLFLGGARAFKSLHLASR